jgi:AcrR family transcriptional regulator
MAERPRPRWSGASTWNSSASAGISVRNMCELVGKPCSSTQLFPSKPHLVEAVLRRRDGSIRAALETYAAAVSTRVDRILAVFDYLYDWFGELDLRGCAFINSYAELGDTSPEVADVVRAHRQALGVSWPTSSVPPIAPPNSPNNSSSSPAERWSAAIGGSPETARHARSAARHLVERATVKRFGPRRAVVHVARPLQHIEGRRP